MLEKTENRKVQISTYVTELDKTYIDKFAKNHKLTISNLMRAALKEYIEKEEK